jgi:steroid delta-isomerase-like uncharacterized protein
LPAEDVARKVVAAVEAGDADALAGLYAEDAVFHHPLTGETRGRDAIRQSEQELFDAFTDIEIEVRSLLADERTAAIELVLRATNSGDIDLGEEGPLPATGRRIEDPMTWWLVLGPDDLIVAERDYLDTAGLMSQLGVTP